jgi:hypothetical protein
LAGKPEVRVLEKLRGLAFAITALKGQIVQGTNQVHLFTISGNRIFPQVAGKPGAIKTIRVVDPLANPLKIDFKENSGNTRANG